MGGAILWSIQSATTPPWTLEYGLVLDGGQARLRYTVQSPSQQKPTLAITERTIPLGHPSTFRIDITTAGRITMWWGPSGQQLQEIGSYTPPARDLAHMAVGLLRGLRLSSDAAGLEATVTVLSSDP